MRVAPTVIDSANIGLADNVNSVSNLSSAATILYSSPQSVLITCPVSGGGLTQYRPYMIMINNSAGYLGFGAEL